MALFLRKPHEGCQTFPVFWILVITGTNSSRCPILPHTEPYARVDSNRWPSAVTLSLVIFHRQHFPVGCTFPIRESEDQHLTSISSRSLTPFLFHLRGRLSKWYKLFGQGGKKVFGVVEMKEHKVAASNPLAVSSFPSYPLTLAILLGGVTGFSTTHLGTWDSIQKWDSCNYLGRIGRHPCWCFENTCYNSFKNCNFYSQRFSWTKGTEAPYERTEWKGNPNTMDSFYLRSLYSVNYCECCTSQRWTMAPNRNPAPGSCKARGVTFWSIDQSTTLLYVCLCLKILT